MNKDLEELRAQKAALEALQAKKIDLQFRYNDIHDLGTLKQPQYPNPAGSFYSFDPNPTGYSDGNFPNQGNTYETNKSLTKALPGVAAKLYQGPGQSGFLNFAMLAFVTLLFESLFFLICYFIYQ